MKTNVTYLTGILILLIYLPANSQVCRDPPKIITYDTTVIGSGNALHTFSFPKFDPALGTLMNVKLDAEISLLYSFELENRESININNYRVRVTRDDDITSTALINPLTNTYVRTYGPYALTSWDGVVGAGTDYTTRGPLYVMNHSMVSHTVTNTADFLGIGNVDFDYESTTYSSVLGSVNYTFNATAQDTIHFRITYTYCASWFLASDISEFFIKKENESAVQLNWVMQNEVTDRIYEVEKSYDGRDFIPVTRIKAQSSSIGNYQYLYSLKEADMNPKLIFRIKQFEKNGTIKYSAIRIVDIKNRDNSSIRAFPNPARSNMQLLFSDKTRSNWKVELINLNGAVAKECNFTNVLSARLDDLQQLPKGVYLLKATDKNSLKIFKERIIIDK